MVEVWPLSIIEGEAEAVSESAGFTVTVTLVIAVFPRESVTSTQKLVVVERVDVVNGV